MMTLDSGLLFRAPCIVEYAVHCTPASRPLSWYYWKSDDVLKPERWP